MEDKKVLAHEIMNKARRSMTEGNSEDAIKHIEDATRIYEDLYKDDAKSLADYYIRLAEILHYKLDDYTRAIDYYQRASKLYDELGDAKISAYCYYTIAEIYDVDLDNLVSSAEALNTALSKYMELEDMDGLVAECFEKIAGIYYRIGENDIALGAIKKAMDIKERIAPTTTKTAFSYHNAGKLCFDMRKLDDAMYYLEKAKALYDVLEGEDSEDYKSVKEEYAIVRAYKGMSEDLVDKYGKDDKKSK